MARIVLSKRLEAAPAGGFAALADVAGLPGRIPAVMRVEVLTPSPVGVGTKFRETRVVFGKEATETFEVTEFEPPTRLTLVAVSCGAEYRCEHRLTPDGTGTLLELEVRTRPRTLVAWLMAPLGWLMTGFMKAAIAKDLDALAKAVPSPAPPPT